jgi:fused signal recognition particle receptor
MGLFKSVFKKVSAALTNTREGIASLWTGGKLSRELLVQLERTMIQSDIGIKTAQELVKDLTAAWERNEIETARQARDYLVDLLIAGWPPEDRTIHFAATGPTVILVCGVNGSGKTTSIAKIAKSLRDEKKSVILAACDTFRAAAVEQLDIWSKRLGVDMIKGKQGGDPAAVAFDAAEAAVARKADVLLVDTAGRLHTQKPLMDQLSKIRNVIAKKIPGAPHEVILVLDATFGTNAVIQAKDFTAATNVTGLFLAKLDGTAKGGIVVAIREQLAIPVKFIGVGETPDDVEPFDPEKFVKAMFEG